MKSQKYEVSHLAERKQQIKCADMSIFLFMYLLPDQSSPQQNPARSEIVSQSVQIQIHRVLGENEKNQYFTLDLPFVIVVQPFSVLTICFLR